MLLDSAEYSSSFPIPYLHKLYLVGPIPTSLLMGKKSALPVLFSGYPMGIISTVGEFIEEITHSMKAGQPVGPEGFG